MDDTYPDEGAARADLMRRYCVAVNRLAAYEDTGLGPDEITTEPYGCVFYCNRKCNLDGDFCAEGPGCPYEIGAATAKHMLDLAQAERDGRLVVLPCKDDAVYTIEEDYFNCAECKNGSGAHYQAKIGRVSCDMDNGERCPFYIKEHEVEGFEISFDATGKAVLSSPGNFGYEGLEQFSGVDGKVYYTREEAEAALKKREEADSENEKVDQRPADPRRAAGDGRGAGVRKARQRILGDY